MFFLSNYVYIRNRWESAFWIYRLNMEYEAPRNPPFGLNQQYLMCCMAITVRKKNYKRISQGYRGIDLYFESV